MNEYGTNEIERMQVEIDLLREANKKLADAAIAKDGKNFDDACKEIDRLRAVEADLRAELSACGKECGLLRAEFEEYRKVKAGQIDYLRAENELLRQGFLGHWRLSFSHDL